MLILRLILVVIIWLGPTVAGMWYVQYTIEKALANNLEAYEIMLQINAGLLRLDIDTLREDVDALEASVDNLMD